MVNHKIIDNFLNTEDFKELCRVELKKIKPNDKNLKVPHMGWNTVTLEKKKIS